MMSCEKLALFNIMDKLVQFDTVAVSLFVRPCHGWVNILIVSHFLTPSLTSDNDMGCQRI